jgi:transcriptional regulator with XRE-family HTH domain
MGFLSVIRRWALRDKMPIREIARRTGLSRNTFRKYLRAEIVEPSFRTPTRPSKLDPFAEKLSGWLVMEVRKSRKDRRTARRRRSAASGVLPRGLHSACRDRADRLLE